MEGQSQKGGKDGGAKCSECQIYAKDPVAGHSKCAKHRACTGTQEWQPYDCDICALLKHTVSKRVKLLLDDDLNRQCHNCLQMIELNHNHEGMMTK